MIEFVAIGTSRVRWADQLISMSLVDGIKWTVNFPEIFVGSDRSGFKLKGIIFTGNRYIAFGCEVYMGDGDEGGIIAFEVHRVLLENYDLT